MVINDSRIMHDNKDDDYNKTTQEENAKAHIVSKYGNSTFYKDNALNCIRLTS